MNYISIHIKGTPYSQIKTKGDIKAPKRWTEAIIEQTKDLPKVSEACVLRDFTYRPAVGGAKGAG